MKKSINIGIILVVIVVILAIMGISTYNNLVEKSEEVDKKYADISAQLERRANLIPNLVETVKGYASHEESVIEKVTASREKLVDAKTPEEASAANAELSTSLNSLFALAENYPDLKANTNFINLQDELAGTENRISIARKDYNEVVQNYNKEIKKFPNNLFAKMLGFDEKTYFEAKDNANEVPNVSFKD